MALDREEEAGLSSALQDAELSDDSGGVSDDDGDSDGGVAPEDGGPWCRKITRAQRRLYRRALAPASREKVTCYVNSFR